MGGEGGNYRQTMTLDLALAEGPDGRPMLHAADCPAVRAAAAQGKFVATLFGCVGEPPGDIERHSCLDRAESARSAAG